MAAGASQTEARKSTSISQDGNLRPRRARARGERTLRATLPLLIPNAPFEGRKPGLYQPGPKRGTSVGPGLEAKKRRGLKARSIAVGFAHDLVPGFQPFPR